MVYNHLIADVVTVIGTQDIVFGEVTGNCPVTFLNYALVWC